MPPNVNAREQCLRVCFWNTRTLAGGKARELAADAGALGWDIVVVVEARRAFSPGEKITSRYSIYSSGCEGGNYGVAFLVHGDVIVEDFKCVTIAGSESRAAYLDIKTVLGARRLYALYAPHAGLGDELVGTFWQEVPQLPGIEKAIVGVDANARVHPWDWPVPPSHTVLESVRDACATNSCGMHLLASSGICGLRPVNMLRTEETWNDRATFKGNELVKPGVIDYILAPCDKMSEHKSGAWVHVPKKNKYQCKIDSDHRPLVMDWTVECHRQTTTAKKRPVTAPERPTEGSSEVEKLYFELWQKVQANHIQVEGENHVSKLEFRHWVPPATELEKARDRVTALKRSGAHKGVIREAAKRARDMALDHRAKQRKTNFRWIMRAFETNRHRDAHRMVGAARRRGTRLKPTRAFHRSERNRFAKTVNETSMRTGGGTVLMGSENAPQGAFVTFVRGHDVGGDDDQATRERLVGTIEHGTELTEECLRMERHFDPWCTQGKRHSGIVYTDGSFSEDRETGSAKCGWAAYKPDTGQVIFGSVPRALHPSVNAAEAAAVQGAVSFLDPRAIATDSKYVEICAANLNAEPCYNMQQLSNGLAWREIWRRAESSPLMVMKVPAHAGIVPNEVSDVFSWLGSQMTPGRVRSIQLSKEDIRKVASDDPDMNERTKRQRRDEADRMADAKSVAWQELEYRDGCVKPRRALDHVPSNGEIKRVVWELCEHSAPGPDGVTPRDIRDERILPLIVALIQEIWRSKQIPALWLKSYLVGIPKAHDTVTRGIALTSTCLKVLTGIIRRRGAGTSLLSCQYGFRSHKGTAQATVLLKQVLERRAVDGRGSTVVFLDLKKAFDSIDRDQLGALMEEYGFGETARTLVTQMYSGDILYLYLDNENKSDPIRPGSGVKQGCLLSPAIFNMYMDRALRKLALQYANVTGLDPEQGPIILAYADDLAVVAKNDEDARRIVERLEEILLGYGLAINEDKTKVLRRLPHTKQGLETAGAYAKRQETMHTKPTIWCKEAVIEAQYFGSRIPWTGTGAKGMNHLCLTYPEGYVGELRCCLCDVTVKSPVGAPGVSTKRTCTTQRLMREHVRKKHLPDGCTMESQGKLFLGLPPPGTDRVKQVRPLMTDAVSRRQLPRLMTPLKCGGKTFEEVEQFVYLGSIIHMNGDHGAEVMTRIQNSNAAFAEVKRTIGRTGEEELEGKRTNKMRIWLLDLYATTRLLYATETWVQTKAEVDKLHSCRMRQIRTLVGGWYTQHVHCRSDKDAIEFHTERCQDCKEARKEGLKIFWTARAFMMELVKRRNQRAIRGTWGLRCAFRKRGHTGRRITKAITHILSFMSMEEIPGCIEALSQYNPTDPADPPQHPQITSLVELTQYGGQRHEGMTAILSRLTPRWPHNMMPLPTQESMMRHHGVMHTETMIEKRRLNLLGNLLRDGKTPPGRYQGLGTKMNWWRKCEGRVGAMRMSMYDAHNITFWRNRVREMRGDEE